ncbi:MAG: P-II family nitrogen regulator [Phycisphaerales bacterium]|nr:P-II family nitrogen regulator [Phycisphaerales bacterium]
MKLITAIIRPEKLEDVRRALAETDVYLMTVSETSGFGRQRGVVEVYRGQELEERMIPKLKVEIAVNDNFVDATVEAIIRGARSAGAGDVGDGKIFVTPLDDVIRIRTGETGPAAIGP